MTRFEEIKKQMVQRLKATEKEAAHKKNENPDSFRRRCPLTSLYSCSAEALLGLKGVEYP